MKIYLCKPLWLCVILSTATACSMDNETAVEPAAEPTMTLTFTALNETTRTALAADDTSVVWQSDDRIGVFTADENNVECRLASGAGSTVADFSGDFGSAASTSFAAYSPYQSAASLVGNTLAVAFPKQQTHVEGSFAPEAAFMVARSTDINFTFRNCFAVLQLQLTCDRVDNLQALTLISRGGEKLSGAATVDLSLQAPVVTVAADGFDRVTLDCSAAGGVRLGSEAATFRIVVPPAAYAEGFEIVAQTDNGVVIFNTKPTLELPRNNIIKTPVRNVVLAPYELSSAGGREVRETANCYVISPRLTEIYGRKVSFPATVMGNGTPFGDSSFTTETIAPTVARLLWQSNPDVVDAVVLRDGFVEVTLGNSPVGNASVAVTDGSNVLWSWLLWCVADELTDQTYDTDTKILLDRNLGALSAARPQSKTSDSASYGLFYQWGRKDPFPNVCWSENGMAIEAATFDIDGNKLAGTTENADYVNLTNTVSSAFEWSRFHLDLQSDVGGTAADAVRYPMWLFLVHDGANGNNWYDAGNGITSKGNRYLWNNAPSMNSTSKSIFDPCPRGYKLPYRYFWKDNAFMSPDAESDLFGGHMFCINAAGDRAWYPAAGKITSFMTAVTNYSDVGTCGFYATSYESKGGEISPVTFTAATSMSNLDDFAPAACASVRCMKDL